MRNDCDQFIRLIDAFERTIETLKITRKNIIEEGKQKMLDRKKQTKNLEEEIKQIENKILYNLNIFTSCSFDISSENIITEDFALTAICCAIFNARAVFPIEGRAASRIKSEGCIPAVL